MTKSRTLYAAGLVVAALAVLLVAWFLSGWADVRAQQREVRAEPQAVAARKGVELAHGLRAELARVLNREADRPYFQYQNLMHDPRAGGSAVSPSPLASGPEDPLVLGYFQLDTAGRTSTPTINDDIPGLSEPKRLAEHRRFRDEVMRNFASVLRPEASPVIVAEAAKPRPRARVTEPPPDPGPQAQGAQQVQIDEGSYTRNTKANEAYWQQNAMPPPQVQQQRVEPAQSNDDTPQQQRSQGNFEQATNPSLDNREQAVSPQQQRRTPPNEVDRPSTQQVRPPSNPSNRPLTRQANRPPMLPANEANRAPARPSAGEANRPAQAPANPSQSVEPPPSQTSRPPSQTNRPPSQTSRPPSPPPSQSQAPPPPSPQADTSQAPPPPSPQADTSPAPRGDAPQDGSIRPPRARPRPRPAPVIEPPPPPRTITISISPFEWRTLPYAGTPALLAVRQIETPDGNLAQGFVVDRATLTGWLATRAGDAVAELRTGDEIAAAEIAPGWHLEVSANPRALASAAADATRIASAFLLRFVLVGIIAMLAAAGAVMVVSRAERLARERSQFAAAAAHELRTPLAGLQLYGDMLADGLGDPGKLRDYARRMSEEASRLGRVVSNVLGFSQLERGNLSVEARAGNLGQVLCELAERAQPALDRAGAVLELDVPPDLTARFDRDALARIVGNLLDNAEKYGRESDDRTISLAARTLPDRVEVTVTDRGPGVPAAARTRLFRAFSRGVTTDGPAGLGLGLALSQSLARAMGGELEYRPGDGTTTFVLRLASG